VKNNGGGHANHTLFWSLLSPREQTGPRRAFAPVLDNAFGSFKSFQERFTKVATEHFSNGWAWLCTDANGQLCVFSAPDHESPLTRGLTPLLVLDLWEHAYYLKNQNRRPDYIEAFWHVANWHEVDNRWLDFQQKGTTTREWLLAS
jgi:Fe-Mn family superoxide dismutase